jgi:hypothetical protein
MWSSSSCPKQIGLVDRSARNPGKQASKQTNKANQDNWKWVWFFARYYSYHYPWHCNLYSNIETENGPRVVKPITLLAGLNNHLVSLAWVHDDKVMGKACRYLNLCVCTHRHTERHKTKDKISWPAMVTFWEMRLILGGSSSTPGNVTRTGD